MKKLLSLLTLVLALLAVPALAQEAPVLDGTVEAPAADPEAGYRFTDLRFAMQDPANSVAFVEVVYFRQSGAVSRATTHAIAGAEYTSLLIALNTPAANEAPVVVDGVPDPAAIQANFRKRVTAWLVNNGKV